MPSSRPKPLRLKPPNGVDTRTDEFELIERTPASIARATRSALAPFSVQIEPEDLLACDPVGRPRLDERGRVPEAATVRRVPSEERLALDEARDLLPVRC